MKYLERIKVRVICPVVLCLMSVLVFGAGSASANMLFQPHSGKFPYHLVGLDTEKVSIGTIGNKVISSTGVHVLVLVLNATLADAHILLLGVKGESVAPCSNLGGNPSSGVVLIELLGHLGLVHTGTTPANLPGVLWLVPSGFSFLCELLGVKEKISVAGSIIGLITHPQPNVASTLQGITFIEAAKGVQQHTLFLLSPSGVVMTDQLLSVAINGGAAEQAAGSLPQILVHALPGEGTFLLVLDP